MCENQSPPCSPGLSRPFKPFLLGLNLRYLNAVTWICDWHAWFSLVYTLISNSNNTFCICKIWSLELVSFFFHRSDFFCRLPAALLVIHFWAVLALFLLQWHAVKSNSLHSLTLCNIWTVTFEHSWIIVCISVIVYYLLLFDFIQLCPIFRFFCSLFDYS